MSRPWILILLALLACPALCAARQEYEITIETTLGDTTETFWLQIPTIYDPHLPCPLLIGWHQLGGGWLEMRDATSFDDEADARGWLCAAMGGPTRTHWTNHSAQSHMADVIRWIEERYAVDPDRIYMVGASMGGAAGMVFSNNRLDPGGPMIAAAASISGIQDCDRRFHEQGNNNSMIGAFGGTPEQVPFTYHRNSAIYFADSTASMHGNARHLPLYLTYGSGTSDSIWRTHAEDLYAVMRRFADTVVLRESAIAGHGWVCAEEKRICDFLGGFTLDRRPSSFSVNVDEEGRAYWADLTMRNPTGSFARFDATTDVGAAGVRASYLWNVQEAKLDLSSLGFQTDQPFECVWTIAEGGAAALSFERLPASPVAVLRDGEPFDGWTYDGGAEVLRLQSTTSGTYAIRFDPASVEEGAPPEIRVWQTPEGAIRYAMPGGPHVFWNLFDVLGRSMDSGEAAGGTIGLEKRLPSGNYFIRLSARGPACAVATRKIVALR